MLSVHDIIRKSANRKNKTKLKRLMEVKRYYLSMYRCYIVKLYDLGYIGDPTRYDEAKMSKTLIEMGIRDMISPTGKVELTSSHIYFAMLKNKNDDEKYEFLNLLYNMYKYREYSRKIDSLYEEFKFAESTNSSEVIKVAMYTKGARVMQRSGIIFDEAVARSISDFSTDTKSVSINEELWDLAMQHLGVPKEDWYADGLFDDILSHDEEVECMEGILNGSYKVSNGKYSALLNDWLFKHIWSAEGGNKFDVLGLYDYLYSGYVNDILSILNTKIGELKIVNGFTDVVGIEKDRIYYNVKREEYLMPVGVFAVVCREDLSEDILPDYNVLTGYTGELYSLERLIEDDIMYVGCPVSMYISKSKEGIFYDLEQTGIQGKSWFEDEGVSITFDESLSDYYNSLPEGTLTEKMYKGYVGSLISPENLVIKVKISPNDNLDMARRELIRSFKPVG